MSAPDYERALALALALAPEERRRLAIELLAGLELAGGAPEPAEARAPTPPVEAAQPAVGAAGAAEPFAGTLDFSSGGEGRVASNGLIVATGEPVAVADVAGIGGRVEGEVNALSAGRREVYAARADGARPILRMVYGKDHGDLREAGWAVVVPASASARLLEALWPLVEHRCRQQGLALPPLSFDPAGAETCAAWLARVAPDEAGAPSPWHPRRAKRVPVLLYEPDSSAEEWLPRYGPQLAAGVVDPDQGVPYYLLFAGRPGPLPQFAGDRAYIPFGVQYDVDLYWGVGRVCFTTADGADDYAAYAAYAGNVVAFEGLARPPYARRIVYFATDHDPATRASRDGLARPLAADAMAGTYEFDTATYGFSVKEGEVPPAASREALRAILRDAPPLLFTATHGADLRPYTSAKLTRQQGALICSDWTGGPSNESHWLDADGLPDDLRVTGMIGFFFACFGVGCPRDDTYDVNTGRQRQLAPFDMVAALPQRLLARGALAVIGHVDVAWAAGYGDPARPQIQGFKDILSHLMDGQRVGFATDAFNTRQAALGSQMSKALRSLRFPVPGQPPPDVSPTWLAYHDARAYALLGDPAVRLPFGEARADDT